LIALLIVIGLICIVLGKSLYLVQQAEVIIIERLGKYHRTLQPGLRFVIPFIDRPRAVRWTRLKEIERDRFYRYIKTIKRIDLREMVDDFPKQSVITRDNVTTEINAVLYYQIVDPYAAVYEVIDLPQAIEKLTQTTLRNVIGSLDLDETLVSRDKINMRLLKTLDEATNKWGVDVTRVELQEVNPPRDIQQAMEKQMRAERDRRAAILEAEGDKSAAILRAEGKQESKIREARGTAEARVLNANAEAEARLQVAQAEAKALQVIHKALPEKDPAAYRLSMQYMKVLPALTEGKDNKLVVVPYEAASLAGTVASIKKVLEETSEK